MPRQDALPRAFLRHIRAHNLSVLWAMAFSILGTVLLWPALYFFITLLYLIYLSVFIGPMAQLPANYTATFTLSALASFPLCMGISWLLNSGRGAWLYNHMYLRWILELLVVPHRLTLSIFGHLRAFCFFSRRDKCTMVALLQMVDDHRKLEVRRLEVEIPNPARRQRLLEGLSILELVTFTHTDGRLFLRLPNQDVRYLIYPSVRLADSQPQIPRPGRRPPKFDFRKYRSR